MLSCDDAIHWAALKRFFTAEDSIFNNNKNFFLRHFTALMFKEMGLIPVNRGGDTRETIELTNYCLKNGSSIGIFPEGTTNKNPSKQELLDIKNGLLYFSKNNNAVIQPISILWTPEEYENRVIVNYRHPFDLENKSSVVVVPDDQLSLAIGKSGQNVRLAVQSSGWKIDIMPTSEAYDKGLLI